MSLLQGGYNAYFYRLVHVYSPPLGVTPRIRLTTQVGVTSRIFGITGSYVHLTLHKVTLQEVFVGTLFLN